MLQRASRVLVTLTCGAVMSVPGPDAAAAGYDPARLEWSRLTFRASKLGITVTSDIAVKSVLATQATADFIQPSSEELLTPRGPDLLQMTVGARLLGRKSSLDLWFDPASTAAYQRVQLETAKRAKHNRYRTLRFAPAGVYSATVRPTDEEVGKPHTQWTRVSDNFKAYPAAKGGDVVVTEPSALFYVLATADLVKQGDTATTHVYSKNHLMEVELTVQEKTRLRVDYVEVSPQGERTVRGQSEVLRILLEGRPLDPQVGNKGFEILGLRGNVDLFLDPDKRVPVQLSGDIKYAGKGHVRLHRVEIKKPSPGD